MANDNEQSGGYDLEAFRKRWYSQGDINNAQGWLDSNRDITQGVTLKGEKAYDASGKFIADLIGNYNQPGKAKSRIFLDGIDSNTGKARTAVKPAPQPVAQTWTAPASSSSSSSSSQSIAPVKDPRLDEMYNLLLSRATQGLAIDRNTPVIRQQADVYSANEERAKRNYLADIAEQAGPIANLRGEQRVASERVGQRTGAFEAELMGRELVARRTEIAEALQSMQGLLTTEQTLALQKEMKTMDDAIARLKLKQEASQFNADLAYRNRALDQAGSQFGQTLGYNYDQFDWERSPLNPRNIPAA